MKIILGIDDSPCSEAAVSWVKGMAWPRGTEVKVVSVDQPPIAVYSEIYAPQAADLSVAMEQTTRRCEEVCARAETVLAASGIRTTARVVRGDPRTEIVEAARAEHADLIVVGSHGHTGMRRLILGSVAQYVVSHAPCCVLVAKTGGREVAAD
jgi:nucleotide-binding universal stress UspA family protein